MNLKRFFWPPSEKQELREKQEEARRKHDEARKNMIEEKKYKGKIPGESEVFQMIRTKLPEINKQKEEISKLTREVHVEDCKNYSVNFTRWGDFLHLDIYRDTPEYDKKQSLNTNNPCQSLTIPLFKVSSLELKEGHEPSTNGVLNILKYSDWYYDYFTPEAEKHFHYTIPKLLGRTKFYLFPTELAKPNTHNNFVVHNVTVTNSGGTGGGSYGKEKNLIIYSIDQYPEYAVDDVITFSGVGQLNIPAGMGKSTYAHLHKILREGYEEFYVNKQTPKRK